MTCQFSKFFLSLVAVQSFPPPNHEPHRQPSVFTRPTGFKTGHRQTAAWLEAGPRGFMPPASDRLAWNAAVLDRATILKGAAEAATLPVPALSDDLYLDFMRSGLREPFTLPYGHRIWRARELALAECVEYQGRFLPALRGLLTAILAEKTWVYPMHDGPVGYTAFRGECMYIDPGGGRARRQPGRDPCVVRRGTRRVAVRGHPLRD